MRPNPEKVLAGVVMSAAVDLIPVIGTPFGQTTAGHIAVLLQVLAQEVDHLADRLHQETLVVKSILAEARPLLPGTVQIEIDAACALTAPDIKVSSLQAVNDAVRAVLITVHVAVEGQSSPEARALDGRIWEELKESTRRRHVVIAR